ncbi:hypothetical protein DVH24_014259 [Malus domestica]|uniref:Uncharacterized protein n=1 Tax=Malus domestica TaxID=3750 RepID=A0A498JIU0_MALDO|nr:hypothetical protein DVH24_014259 [Malus domestica]
MKGNDGDYSLLGPVINDLRHLLKSHTCIMKVTQQPISWLEWESAVTKNFCGLRRLLIRDVSLLCGTLFFPSSGLKSPASFIFINLLNPTVTSRPRPRPHPELDSIVVRYCQFWAPTTPSHFVFWNSHENFSVGHPYWDYSRSNSLNFGVPMEPEANELPKGLVLGRDENIHIRPRGSTPLGDVGCNNPHFRPRIGSDTKLSHPRLGPDHIRKI